MRTPKTLAARLKWARRARDLNARQVDDLAHLTRGHTMLIERGLRVDPSVSTVAALARALGVSLDWLIAGYGPFPPPITKQGDANA